MQTKIFVLAAFVLAIAGCGENSRQTDLEKQNSQLMQELAAKDKFIEDVSSSINEIHNKLDAVWAVEKNIMGQTSSIEGGAKLTQAQLKEQILDRISGIQNTLEENRKKVSRLQQRLKESNTKYAGLDKLVEDLKKNLDEREKSIAEMQSRIQNLEGQVSQQVQVINQHEATIGDQAKQIEEQKKQMNTAYYTMGSRDELKKKGIITKEGGILWGLLGTTTVLSNNFEDDQFRPLDKTTVTEIEVPGRIDEIIPKRDESMYMKQETEDHRTVLKITNPAAFWKENRLVIVTDEPVTVAQLEP